MDKYINRITDLDTIPDVLQEQVFQKLSHVAELVAFQPQEQAAYQASLKYYRDLKNVIDTAFGEGLQQGMAQGIETGQKQALVATARKMKLMGLPDDQIAQATGLPLGDIDTL
jgi:predicted transposase/invertase (TIGR01784 family)